MPDAPFTLYRRSDPDTSRAAAETASETLRKDRLKVYEYFKRVGQSTDLEMQQAFKDMRSTWRSRRNDLTQPPWNLIRDSGKRKWLEGRGRIVWELTPRE